MVNTPIFQRICEAFRPGEMTLPYPTLALRVFPPEDFPRAWRYSSNGGPPGCYMALSSALRRYGITERYNRDDVRIVHRPASRSALKEASDNE